MRIPFLRTKPQAPSEHPVLTDTVEPGTVRDARTRARQRLTGALVLLVLGVVLFPLLFETQPRPLAVDTPIVVAARDGSAGAPAVVAAPAPAPVVGPVGGPVVGPVESPISSRPLLIDAAREVVEPVVPPLPVAMPAVPTSVAKAAQISTPAPTSAQAPAVAVAAGASDPVPASAPARYVVQAGAYGEASAVREARQKVEKLGLKTFIQVIDNGSGKRTRVRVGPFETRQEAEGVAAKVKAAGLQANVLAL